MIACATIAMIASDLFNTLNIPAAVTRPGDYHLVWYFPLSMYASMFFFGVYFFARAIVLRARFAEKLAAALFLFANAVSLLYLFYHDSWFAFDQYILVWRLSAYGVLLGIAGVWLIVGLLHIVHKHYKDVD